MFIGPVRNVWWRIGAILEPVPYVGDEIPDAPLLLTAELKNRTHVPVGHNQRMILPDGMPVPGTQSNEHLPRSELCSLSLDPARRKGQNRISITYLCYIALVQNLSLNGCGRSVGDFYKQCEGVVHVVSR